MLLDLNKKNEKEFMDKFIGRDMEVLYEQMYNENSYEGYTPNYIKVISQSKEPLQGKILRTRLKSIKEDYIIGEIISK